MSAANACREAVARGEVAGFPDRGGWILAMHPMTLADLSEEVGTGGIFLLRFEGCLLAWDKSIPQGHVRLRLEIQ